MKDYLLDTNVCVRLLRPLLALNSLLSGCNGEQKGRAHLYDFQLSEQATWHVDRLTPIPDSFLVVVNVYAERGKQTRYTWSPYGKERFGQLIQKPTATLSAQLSDSLFYLAQRVFANIPAPSEQEHIIQVDDARASRIELNTTNNSLNASIIDQSYSHTEPLLFLLRQSRKHEK